MRGRPCEPLLVPLPMVGALLALFVAGCADEAPRPDAKPPLTAQVGPTCPGLRESEDAESDAYLPLIDFVYRSDDGVSARYDALTKGQRMLWATMVVEGEVNNGGFNQYFFNTGGETLADAIRGFETFGSTEHAKLAREAAELYRKDRERIAQARAEGTLDAFSESYESEPYAALDSRFFELASPPGRLAYVKSHAREFCVP
jgi:Domain of unknown function (DUF4375)